MWQFIGVVLLACSVTSHPTTKIILPLNAATSLNSTHTDEGMETDGNYTGQMFSVAPNASCFLSCPDPNVPSHIRHLIDVEEVKLIEYTLVFPFYNASPLISNYTFYKAESWARASTRHGQTLLSLSFNYGILSMMTLSVGTAALEVPLIDHPEGCIAGLTETEQFDRIIYLMLRDFQADQPAVTVKGDERLCHEAIVDKNGYAVFVDMCCHQDPHTLKVDCKQDEVNIWLRLLQFILSVIRFGVLFFGPLLFVSAVVSISRKNFPYKVELKEPLTKTVVLKQGEIEMESNISAKQCLNLRHAEGFAKLNASIANVPMGKPVPIKISQYDILVSYKRTLTENSVPVGFWKGIFGAVFRCKLQNVGPFRDCCRAPMCWSPGKRAERETRWISLWSKVGLVLMVLLIPTPYYLRLYVFYEFEYDEVVERKEAAARLGLKEPFSSNPLHYLMPTHPIFIVIYLVYFVTAGVIGFTMRSNREGVFLRIIAGAFDDLNSLEWTTILHVLVSNIIWPFKYFGIVGCFVAVVYWPLAIPLCLLLCVLYCLPTVYLTVRMFFHARNIFLLRTNKRVRVRPYRARKRPDNSIKHFDVDRRVRRDRRGHGDADIRDGSEEDFDLVDLDLLPMKAMRQASDSTSVGSMVPSGVERTVGRCFALLLASLLCVAALCSSLVIVSECLGCIVEVALFTLMGVIVNAAVLLKYVALIILLVVYSYDCFNDVQKNYLKLNKALFSEVKGRVKDIDKITSMPSHRQENQGFKSQELSEQAFYEDPDNIEARPPGFWFINDLVLFIDNEDMPRIPLKLFEEVCQIRVAGVPGPVFRGQLMALQRFSKIVLFVFFVFVVVLSFSEAYQVSSTNQMLATLAGGFLPLILRALMGSGGDSELELNTLSFRSKLDEVIKNFSQYWPIYDLPFELDPTPPKEDENQSLEEVTKLSLVLPVENGKLLDGKTYGKIEPDTELSPRGVTFAEENSEGVEVDLMIDLPQQNSGLWLSQWSDFGSATT